MKNAKLNISSILLTLVTLSSASAYDQSKQHQMDKTQSATTKSVKPNKKLGFSCRDKRSQGAMTLAAGPRTATQRHVMLSYTQGRRVNVVLANKCRADKGVQK